MEKYHINDNGNVGKCSAEFKCPFGDLQDDHYSSKEEALKAQEAKNAEKILSPKLSKGSKRLTGSPILREKSRMELKNFPAKYFVDYDYDYYGCEDPEACAKSDDFCRDGVYRGLRVTGWSDPDGLADYVKSRLNIPRNQRLPKELKDRLQPYADTVINDFEAFGEHGYYGEEVAVEPPEYLEKDLKEYYWDQPNASDKSQVLPYLRGKGFETQGLSPIKAVKEHLKAESGRKKLPERIQNAKRITVSSVSLKKIKVPNKEKLDKNIKSPKSDSAVPGSGTKVKFQGVLLQTGDNEYELVDGYGRYANLAGTNKRKSNYIVIDGRDQVKYSEYGWSYE